MPGPCDPSNYEATYTQIDNNRVELRTHPDSPPTPAQLDAVRAALRLIPPQHLLDFDQQGGYIQFSREGCTPARGGGHQPGPDPWIRLSHACLSEDYNNTLNVTLLHEMGHIVDAEYGGMESLHTVDEEGYRLLADTKHAGATQGPGEAFADCYMIYLITQRARRHYRHRADPTAYQGDNATRRFQALLRSAAFGFGEATILTPLH